MNANSQPPKTPPPPTQPSRPSRPTTPPPTRPKKAEAEELLPVRELAERWRVTPAHIYNLIAEGLLRSTQVGIGRAKTRIPASAAAEFIARRSTKGRAA